VDFRTLGPALLSSELKQRFSLSPIGLGSGPWTQLELRRHGRQAPYRPIAELMLQAGQWLEKLKAAPSPPAPL